MTDDQLTRRLVDGIAAREALADRSDLLDRRAAVAYLGVGIRRFDAEVIAGAVPVAYRARRKYLFDPEDLDRWKAAHSV